MKLMVLVVEDEPNIAEFVSTMLNAQEGMRAIVASSGKEAKTLFYSAVPDIVLLDLGLPDIDGMELITEFRSKADTPVVILSARMEETEKVKALDLGADDYITKPFSTEELLARLRAVRRRFVANGSRTIYQCEELYIDLVHPEVRLKGERVNLTNTEYKILAHLAKHAGKVVTHESISREVWGPHHMSDSGNLRVNLMNIRRKIDPNSSNPKYIFTEPGMGYRLKDNEYKKNT